MPKTTPPEQLSKFGQWCIEDQNLSRKDVAYLTGFSYNYVSLLFRGEKELTPYWDRFFMDWWVNTFTDDVKSKLLEDVPK